MFALTAYKSFDCCLLFIGDSDNCYTLIFELFLKFSQMRDASAAGPAPCRPEFNYMNLFSFALLISTGAPLTQCSICSLGALEPMFAALAFIKVPVRMIPRIGKKNVFILVIGDF